MNARIIIENNHYARFNSRFYLSTNNSLVNYILTWLRNWTGLHGKAIHDYLVTSHQAVLLDTRWHLTIVESSNGVWQFMGYVSFDTKLVLLITF